MSSFPGHSIVMAAYNAAATLEHSARSVLLQSDPDLELIIVDDGSTDSTLRIAEQLASSDERVIVVSRPQGGPSAARNLGASQARGELITFLDSDDFLLRSFLRTMRSALDAEPDAGIGYADTWVLDRDTELIRKTKIGSEGWHFEPPSEPPADPLERAIALASINFIGGVRTVRREALESAGGFDESLSFAEDYDLWMRIVLRGFALVHVPEAIVVVSDRPGSLSKNREAMDQGIAAVCRKIEYEYEAPPEVKAAAARQYALIEERAARYARFTWRLGSNVKRVVTEIRYVAFPARYWHTTLPEKLASELPLLSELGGQQAPIAIYGRRVQEHVRQALIGNRIVRFSYRMVTLARALDLVRSKPRESWDFLLRGKELTNFTYENANVADMERFVADVTGSPLALVREIFAEIGADERLMAELGRALESNPRRESDPKLGYRRVSYAIVRLTKPAHSVELGTHDGMGAALIASALERNAAEGSPGVIHSHDLSPESGWVVPSRLRKWIRFHYGPISETLPVTLSETLPEYVIVDIGHAWDEQDEVFRRVRETSTGRLVLITEVDCTTNLPDFAKATGGRYVAFKEVPLGHFWRGHVWGAAIYD